MRAITFETSLRRKITLAYAAIALLILAVSLFAFEELKLVEGKVLLGERIAELFDTVLEIRRYERNFFLHAQEADYRENLAYVAKTRGLLETNSEDFALIGTPGAIVKLRDGLERYSALMARYVGATSQPPSVRTRLEGEVRAAGKEIVAIAEVIVTTERQAVRSSLATFRVILVVSIVGVMLLVIAVGQGLSMSVVQPLKQIENDVDAVSRGRGDKLPLASQDREIVSITNAFNHMLRELELRQKHLLRSEKLASLGTMLAGVAHELNNPLSNIWTSCQIMQDELGSAGVDDQRELLRQIDEQSIRARNIVRSLLDFARDREFIKEPVTLRPLVQQTLRFIKGEIPPGVAITIDIADDIVVSADKQRLQQVFVNLIKNAIDAVGVAGEILIDAKRFAPGTASADAAPFAEGCGVSGEAIEITVRDNGAGVAAEVLPRMFDPFFTTKDVGSGMGLGLFVVYEIIEEHDGCITATSEVWQGTSFHIRLPVTQGEALAAARAG